MIAQVHQHPDGAVYVRVDSEVYVDTPANFATDFGEALPDLPPGAVERIYDQGVRHPILDGVNIIDGGPMPWPLGDQIIAAIHSLLAAQQARQALEKEPA
jgi:hypothetical protein